MTFLKVLLMLVEIISGVLLVGVILLQKSKDEGLGLAFGAGVGETLFGSRAGNVLTKITIGLGIVFMANTLLIGYVMSGGSSTGSITDSLPAQAAPLRPAAPAGGMAPAASPEAVPAPGAAPAPQAQAPIAVPEAPVAPIPVPVQGAPAPAPAPAAP